MPTATATKPASAVSRLLSDLDELAVAGETLCQKAARGESLDARETNLLETISRQLGWREPQDSREQNAIERQIGRVESALRWKRQAGTNAELAVAKSNLAAAQKALADNRAVIEERIRAAQAELADLEQAATRSAQRVESMQAARAHLRKLAPISARKAFDAKLCEINTHFNEWDLPRLESRLTMLKGVTALNLATYDGQEQAALHAQAVADSENDLLHVTENAAGTSTRLNVDAFRRYQAELGKELAGLEPHVAELRAQRAAAEEKARELLDFYLT
jgi:hypothetical protein